MKPQRLDKTVAAQTGITRSAATALIRRGRVTVDGAICRDTSRKVDPACCTVTVEGQELTFREHVYLMVNKPSGLLCVSRDPHSPTVADLAPEQFRRRELFPAGRLDKDSCGLVLLTDDGAFAHRLLSPKQSIFKRYAVRVDGPIGQEVIDAFAHGVTLADGTPCLPARLRILEDGAQPLTEVSICEGRYHQIKRMFGVYDLGVCFLKRIAIGRLELDTDLEEGACRLLSEEEISSVFEPAP